MSNKSVFVLHRDVPHEFGETVGVAFSLTAVMSRLPPKADPVEYCVEEWVDGDCKQVQRFDRHWNLKPHTGEVEQQ